MIDIRKSSYLDYIFLFGKSRTPYSDYSVNNALSSGGKLHILYKDRLPCGYICISKDENLSRITYVFIEQSQRQQGYMVKLLRYEMEHTEKPLQISIAEDHRCYCWLNPLLKKMGFIVESSCIVYGCEPKDYSKWAGYMAEKGQKLNDMLIRHGFSCMSFRRTDKSILDEIYKSDTSDFGNPLSVKPFFDNDSRCMDMDMSFAAVKDSHLAAYSLVSRPQKKCAVFEQTAVSNEYRGSGVIFLPFSRSMDSVAVFGCTKASYAIYESNLHSNAFRKKVVDRVTSSKRRSENYCYRKER